MSAELDYPAWPPVLIDQTPLPFMYWRVMHVVDGRRGIDKISAALGLKEPQLRQIMAEVRNWLDRATIREQQLTEDLQEALRQALVSVVGPMGELMIDDALDDLPEQTTLSALVSSLNTQLSEPHSQALARILRSRGIA